MTNSEARRLIEHGAVSIDGVVIKDWKAQVELRDGMILKYGKRKYVRLIVKTEVAK